MEEAICTSKAVALLYGRQLQKAMRDAALSRGDIVWISFEQFVARLEPLLLGVNLFDCLLGAFRFCDTNYTQIIHTFHIALSEDARERILAREGEDHLRGVPDDLQDFREGLACAVTQFPNSEWYLRLIGRHCGSVDLGYEAWRHLRRLASQDVLVDIEASSNTDTWWRDRFRSVKRALRAQTDLRSFVKLERTGDAGSLVAPER